MVKVTCMFTQLCTVCLSVRTQWGRDGYVAVPYLLGEPITQLVDKRMYGKSTGKEPFNTSDQLCVFVVLVKHHVKANAHQGGTGE